MYNELIKFFQQIAADPKMPPLPNHLEEDYIIPLARLINKGGCLSEYFSYIDEGSYKQVYDFGENYVLKLVTEGEHQEQFDIDLPNYFLKTYSFFFSKEADPFDLLYWDCGEGGFEEDDDHPVIGIQIQPRAEFKPFKLDDVRLDNDLRHLNVSKRWADDLRLAYGEAAINKLLKLNTLYGLSDLHCDNTAYFKGTPVIIDYYISERKTCNH